MFKKNGYQILTFIIMFCSTLCNMAWANNAKIVNARGIQFEAKDEKNTGYAYPTFRFSVKLPDGSLIGWNKETGQWTGTIKKSKVIAGTFKYPVNSSECTSTEPEIIRYIDVSGINGEYTIKNAMYCKDIFSGSNTFYGTGIAAIIGNIPDGKVEVTIYPEANAVIFTCSDFSVENEDWSLNNFCNVEKYNSHLIVAPGVEQKVEMNYNFTSVEKTTTEKVVTPATLSGSWDSCHKLGLIKNSGLYTSVQKKLENAKRKHNEGGLEAAEGIYGALVNELKAQYGKGIDAQCAGILIEDLQSMAK